MIKNTLYFITFLFSFFALFLLANGYDLMSTEGFNEIDHAHMIQLAVFLLLIAAVFGFIIFLGHRKNFLGTNSGRWLSYIIFAVGLSVIGISFYYIGGNSEESVIRNNAIIMLIVGFVALRTAVRRLRAKDDSMIEFDSPDKK